MERTKARPGLRPVGATTSSPSLDLSPKSLKEGSESVLLRDTSRPSRGEGTWDSWGVADDTVMGKELLSMTKFNLRR
ncbi:MAG: hypothetical protein AB2693_29380 [Candidatus Thiodiazotropha sp.]